MDCPILIFAMHRSGGSYVSQILSGGRPILSEPVLPSDGFGLSLTENVQRFQDFQSKAKGFHVVKLCNFGPYLDMLADRRTDLPDGFQVVLLFRNPLDQIASHLFTFCDWTDPWSERRQFWDAIEAYRRHFDLALEIQRRWPAARLVKYEDTIGEGYAGLLTSIYGEGAEAFLSYAKGVKDHNFKLGPVAYQGTWKPAGERLLKKEKSWICDRLELVMGALGYGR